MSRNLLRVVMVAAAAILIVPLVILGVWRSGHDHVLAGVHVGDLEVGGLDRSELEERIEGMSRERGDVSVVVTGTRGEVESTRTEAGVRADADPTADAAWQRGRQGNPLAAFADHLRARTGGTIDVELREQIDHEVLQSWASDTAADLSAERRDATIRFHDGNQPPGRRQQSRAEPVQPAPGVTVDPEALADAAEGPLLEGGPVTLEAPEETDDPVTTQADLDAVLPTARQAVSDAVDLRNPTSRGRDLHLWPADLAAVLELRTDEDAEEGERLQLAVSRDALLDRLGDDRIERMEVAPRDAEFVVDGNKVRIRGGRRGYRFRAGPVAEEVFNRATSDDRTGELPGKRPRADFARSDARDLGIKTRVSEFTTEHACCESRVTNIQRFADLVDGTIIRPGDSFSLNDHVGRRTRAKGFVPGGVIIDGEFEEEVGGGISQFATTFFNAAFFSGIQIDDFQPHSYYISRYPAGHESTIAYGVIDVAVTNDSPYGILVKTSYTDTSITVSFYSSEWADVDVETSGRRNVVEGDVRDGFDISFTRTITYPDGEREVEEYFHRYQPENEDSDD